MKKIEAHHLIAQRTTVPRLADGLVERPVLEERIARLIDTHHLLLVSATAGAGKTTAVARAAALRAEPTAWLTLDDSDTSATRLLLYVEASLADTVPSAAGVARHALATGLARDEAAGLLLEAVGETPVTLVLDELEHIQNAPDAWRLIESYRAPTDDPQKMVHFESARDLVQRMVDVGNLLCGTPEQVRAQAEDIRRCYSDGNLEWLTWEFWGQGAPGDFNYEIPTRQLELYAKHVKPYLA